MPQSNNADYLMYQEEKEFTHKENMRVKMSLNRSQEISLSTVILLKSPMCCKGLAMFKIIVEKDIKCIMVCDLLKIVPWRPCISTDQIY